VSRLNRGWLPPVLLALATVAITLWLARWGVRNHSWGNDEELYRHFAQGVARDFPFGIFHLDPTYGRGIQRLHLLLMALPMALFKNPAAFTLIHLIFAAVYASTAIPAWLIARGCGLGRWQALVPALLVPLTPWAVVTTSFLAEPVGYGVFVWALWAIWRAAARPSLAADALAVVLLFLAVVSRTAFILLVPVLPAVAILQAWHEATGEGPAAVRLKRLPPAALRRQPLAIAMALAGIAIFMAAKLGIVSGGIGRFTGSYATGLPPLREILLKWRTFLSRIDAGTGFLAFAAAAPWLVARAIRPRREPALHAFAWTGLLGVFAVLMSIVWSAGDERYIMFIAAPVVLAAAIALMRRQVGPLMLAAGGAAALALYFTPGWHLTDSSDFGYFGYPAEVFMGRVVLVKLAHGASGHTVAAILVAAGLTAAVLIAWRPSWRRLLPWVLAPAAVFQLLACDYAISRHVNSVGAAHGPSLRARAFVDTHVPKGEQVGIYAVSSGLTGNYAFAWRDIQYWNTRMRSVVKVQSPISAFPSADVPYPYSTFDIEPVLDQRTGRLSYTGKYPLPRYLVIPQPPLSVALDWQILARSTYLPAALVRVRRWQARTSLAGTSPDGYSTPTTPVLLTVYRAGATGARCAFADLIAPQADRPRPGLYLSYVVTRGRRTVARGRLEAGARRRVFLPLRYSAGSPSARFKLTDSDTVIASGGAKLGLQVGNFDTVAGACPRTTP
jgi:hypothetical protein